MFLFRRRKENIEIKPDELKLDELEKLEKSAKTTKMVKPVVKPAAKPAEKNRKEKAGKKAEAAGPVKDPFFQSEDSLQIIENDAPVKVVIPASALLEDDAAEEPEEKIAEPEAESEDLSEDEVDGLFEKVNQGKEIPEEDVSLDAILPPTAKKAGTPVAEAKPAAGKPVPAAASKPALVEKEGEFTETQPEALLPVLPPAAAELPGATQTVDQAQLKADVKPAVETVSKDQVAEAKLAAAEAKLAAAEVKLATAESKPAADVGSPAADTKLPGATDTKAPAAEEKPADKKKEGEENKGNLFSQLFGKIEELEETPLDRLIKALPEISIEEVMNEAEEVKGLMSEFFQNQTK